MAIEPLSMGLVALTGYGVYSRGQRRGRKMRRTKASGPRRLQTIPKTPLVITHDCSSWDMPEEWIIQTAQPRFRKLAVNAMAATKGDLAGAKAQGLLDPIAMTYAILHREIGSCPEPLRHLEDGTTLTFRRLQTDSAEHDDYYPHPAILGLFDTIFEAVEAALAVLEQTGEPGRALLFPV